MKIALADIETNGLTPDKIHFIRVKTLDGFVNTFFDMNLFATWVEIYQPDRWVFHNGLGFDVWWINKLIKPLINPRHVIDTAVVSRLVDYKKFNTHSLAELGQYLGVHKGTYTGSWDVCNDDMIKYGEQDVEVLEAVFNHYKPQITDLSWAMAMRVEHDMAIVCHDMSGNGFHFDKAKAEAVLEEITTRIGVIEKELQEAFPPRLKEVKRLKYRIKKDGQPVAAVTKAAEEYTLTKIEGDELVCYSEIDFNPASSQDRIDALWDAGWKPWVKTKGHKNFEKAVR
jgi:hypothetical protein